MKLCTFRQPHESEGSLLPGVVVGNTAIDLTSVIASGAGRWLRSGGRFHLLPDTSQMFTAEGLDTIRAIVADVERNGTEAIRSRGVAAFPTEAVQLGPPVPSPGKIVAAGRNYAAHFEEALVIWKERGREVSAPKFPTGFIKVPSAIIGPGDDIIYPPTTREMDYEVELAVVISRYARDIDPAEALEYVAGYTVMNDVSARDIQFREMDQVGIVAGKNFETFAPMGPYVVTADQIPDPQTLRITCSVNGELRQDSNTSEMTFSVAEILSYFSQIGLYPGDVVMTGSPEGIAASKRPDPTPFYLKPGDVVEVEAIGIGRLTNTVVARS